MNNLLVCLVTGLAVGSHLQNIMAICIVIVGIGFLIFVHELGHFLVAKYEKVRVEAFALGFGPAIFKRKYGETEYRINILPLGGYVKMAGEIPGEGTTGAPDEFTSKTPGQRARILVAGVFMNAVFGVVGAVLAFQFGMSFIAPSVGYVVPGSPAWQSGIEKGDQIVAIDGQTIAQFKDIMLSVAATHEHQKITIQVRRNGQDFYRDILPEYDANRGFPVIGIAPSAVAQIELERQQWQIIKIGDQEIRDMYDLADFKLPPPATSLQITVKRGEATRTVPMTLSKQKATLLGIETRQLKVRAFKHNSLAEKSGLQKGDEVLEVAGIAIVNKDKLYEVLRETPHATWTVLRNGQQLKIFIQSDQPQPAADTTSSDKHFLDGIAFAPDLFVGKVLPSSKAAGILQPGDRLVAIQGKPLQAWSDIIGLVAEAKNGPLQVTFERKGVKETKEIEPIQFEQSVWGSGLSSRNLMVPSPRYTIIESCREGFIHAQQMFMEIFYTLRGLVSRRIATKNLGGPITIFSASYTILQYGFGDFLYFLALISINLAVLNLLPIPILDGGHLLFVTIEKIRGKPVSEKISAMFNYLGFIFLITLMVYVTFNDVIRFWF